MNWPAKTEPAPQAETEANEDAKENAMNSIAEPSHDWRKDQLKESKRNLKMQCIAMAISCDKGQIGSFDADTIVKTAQAFYDFARK